MGSKSESKTDKVIVLDAYYLIMSAMISVPEAMIFVPTHTLISFLTPELRHINNLLIRALELFLRGNHFTIYFIPYEE